MFNLKSIFIRKNFYRIVLFFFVSIALCPFILAQSLNKPLILPVRYDEHRFYVEPVTENGTKISFYTDTGGGTFIYKTAAERLNLSSTFLGKEGNTDIYAVQLPEFKPGISIPSVLQGEGKLPVYAPPATNSRAFGANWDGMLGERWFGGRVWTFDYPQKQLILRATGDVPQQKAQHQVSLGFKTDANGKRTINFPRIQVEIAGEILDLLFDTGATTNLSDSAHAALNDNRAKERATSFIIASMFEKWRKKHSDWRVIEQADMIGDLREPMIEVPQIKIAGYEVGPVWFTCRRDGNFHQYMSQWMDKKVEGAIGGNALQHFRITVDYPKAIAVFEK